MVGCRSETRGGNVEINDIAIEPRARIYGTTHKAFIYLVARDATEPGRGPCYELGWARFSRNVLLVMALLLSSGKITINPQ